MLKPTARAKFKTIEAADPAKALVDPVPEIRSALVNNPRTPTSLAVKLLPTLPEREIRHIAKSAGVSQALMRAAIRILMNRG